MQLGHASTMYGHVRAFEKKSKLCSYRSVHMYGHVYRLMISSLFLG